MQDNTVSTAVSIDPNAVGTLAWRTRSLISRGIRSGYGQHGADTGLIHGPRFEHGRPDCGCGWGLLCDAPPHGLCEATPYRP